MLKCKTQNYEMTKIEHRKMLHDIGLGKVTLDMTSNAEAIMGKQTWLHQTPKLPLLSQGDFQMQPAEWGWGYLQFIWWRLIPRMYDELKQSNNKPSK